MTASRKILAIIPAKGTSKGLPGKNKKLLAGQSIVERSFRCGKAVSAIDRIILSTDDEGMAKDARDYGLEVPFMRPAKHAEDTTPMIDVVVHALEELQKERYYPTAVLLLQPTSPFRTPEQIERALELLGDNDSVCSVYALPQGLSPHYLMRVTDAGLLEFYMTDGSKYTRRQDVPVAYKRDGTIFLTKTTVLLEQRSFYGKTCIPMVLSKEDSLNIDDKEDWDEAERRLGIKA